MNTILDNIYGLVVRPVKTLEDVTSGEKLKEGIITVSYTHLDVYKRQV